MADQNTQNSIAYKLDTFSETDTSNVLIPTAHAESARLEKQKSEKIGNSADDLILALQNKQENCRARQVFEWETARRNSLNNFARGAA